MKKFCQDRSKLLLDKRQHAVDQLTEKAEA